MSANGSRVAHGFHRSQLIAVGACGAISDDNGEHEGVDGGHDLAVCHKGADDGCVTYLQLEIAEHAWVKRAVREARVMSLTVQVEPCSFCFCDRLADTVGERLGFTSTIQWGADGHVATRTLRVPPFLSARTHNLDHVDYVLLMLDDVPASSLTEVEVGARVVRCFGKIVLTPVYRNERSLNTEASLTHLTRFRHLTVRLVNPDLTPYHLNGADWSLSLMMVA